MEQSERCDCGVTKAEVGHVVRFIDNRQICTVVERYPRDQKQQLGKPSGWWEDGIVGWFGPT